MNIKRIAIVGCAVALVGAMTATAFAGTVTGNGMFANKGQQAALTATQVEQNAADREILKADRDATREARMADKVATKEARQADKVATKEARQADRDANREDHHAEMTAMTATWDALTDIEKEAVYQLQEDKINAQIAIIDEYLALGLIDADRASEMKSNLTEKIADLRTDGEFPMMGGFGNGRVEDGNQDKGLCTTTDAAVTK